MTQYSIHNTQHNPDSPASLGFRMPAEWHPHKATWLAWPHNESTWHGERLKNVEKIYYEIISALLPGEKVQLLVNNNETEGRVRQHLEKQAASLSNLHIHIIPTADAWIRDYGPTFIINENGSKAWCKWIFNAWGNKYTDLVFDNTVFKKDASILPETCFTTDVVLEGGSIEVNGEGICLATEQCLLDPSRNPSMNKAKIEQFLGDSLGVKSVLWLSQGIRGDDTDGHIDNIARFTDTDTILIAYEDNKEHPNHKPLHENWERLKNSRDQNGQPWNLIRLPMPNSLYTDGGQLPASYANFYIANEIVLLPVYNDPRDKEAIEILEYAFPSRKIVPIVCSDLIHGLGSIHCITQQEPDTAKI